MLYFTKKKNFFSSPGFYKCVYLVTSFTHNTIKNSLNIQSSSQIGSDLLALKKPVLNSDM